MNLNSIFDYVKSLIPILNKNDLLESCRTMSGQLTSSTLPIYREAEKTFGKYKPQSPRVQQWYSHFAVAPFKGKNPISIILNQLEKTKDILDYVDQELVAIATDKISADGMTARTASLVRTLDAVNFANSFSLVFLSHFYIFEIAQMRNDESYIETQTSPAQIESMESSISSFVETLAIIGKNKNDFAVAIDNIPEVSFSTDSRAILGTLGENRLNPLGYNGAFGITLLYRIRMSINQYHIQTYERDRKYKQTLELRLQQMVLEQDKNPSPQIDKRISDTQSEINKLEYKIHKFEKQEGGM